MKNPYDPNCEIVPARFLPLVVGISALTVWRLRKLGLFPEPIQLTIGRIGWRRSDLNNWLDMRQRNTIEVGSTRPRKCCKCERTALYRLQNKSLVCKLHKPQVGEGTEERTND